MQPREMGDTPRRPASARAPPSLPAHVLLSAYRPPSAKSPSNLSSTAAASSPRSARIANGEQDVCTATGKLVQWRLVQAPGSVRKRHAAKDSTNQLAGPPASRNVDRYERALLNNEERRVNLLAQQQAQYWAGLQDDKWSKQLQQSKADLQAKCQALKEANATIRSMAAAATELAATVAKAQGEARRANAELTKLKEKMKREKDWQVHRGKSSVGVHLPAQIAPVLDSALNTAIAAAGSAVLNATIPDGHTLDAPAGWNLAAFLAADNDVLDSIGQALSYHLRERLDERRLPSSEAVARTYLEAIFRGAEETIGAGGGRQALAALLLDSPLAEVLADKVADKARQLVEPSTWAEATADGACDRDNDDRGSASTDGSPPAGETPAAELSAKFLESPQAAYGDAIAFFKGLEALVGEPCRQDLVADSMRFEHTARDDAVTEFTTGNYKITTSSTIEYWFVVDPVRMARTVCADGKHWPCEQVLLADNKRRQPQPMAAFDSCRERMAPRLSAAGTEPLTNEEFLGARLYTGPMFEKYNTVLRAMQRQVAFFVSRFEQLCNGNKYTDTLHSINSCIIKLGRLTRATRLYRGMSGLRMPCCFEEEDEHLVMGGTELGFMSASGDHDLAMAYATSKEPAILLEIQQGMVGRGGDLSWLSQYPFEKEITFPPCTALEALRDKSGGPRTRIEAGRVVVWELRPTVSTRAGGIKAQLVNVVHMAASPAVEAIDCEELQAAIHSARVAGVNEIQMRAPVEKLNKALLWLDKNEDKPFKEVARRQQEVSASSAAMAEAARATKAASAAKAEEAKATAEARAAATKEAEAWAQAAAAKSQVAAEVEKFKKLAKEVSMATTNPTQAYHEVNARIAKFMSNKRVNFDDSGTPSDMTLIEGVAMILQVRHRAIEERRPAIEERSARLRPVTSAELTLLPRLTLVSSQDYTEIIQCEVRAEAWKDSATTETVSELANQQAQACRNALIAAGVPETQLLATGTVAASKAKAGVYFFPKPPLTMDADLSKGSPLTRHFDADAFLGYGPPSRSSGAADFLGAGPEADAERRARAQADFERERARRLRVVPDADAFLNFSGGRGGEDVSSFLNLTGDGGGGASGSSLDLAAAARRSDADAFLNFASGGGGGASGPSYTGGPSGGSADASSFLAYSQGGGASGSSNPSGSRSGGGQRGVSNPFGAVPAPRSR